MQSKVNAAAVKYCFARRAVPGGFTYQDLVKVFEEGAKWQSEAYPLYTDKDMIDFANGIGQDGFAQYSAGIWYTDQFNNRLTYTTEELLKLYLNTRIPTKI